jgi:hypothetical protein
VEPRKEEEEEEEVFPESAVPFYRSQKDKQTHVACHVVPAVEWITTVYKIKMIRLIFAFKSTDKPA